MRKFINAREEAIYMQFLRRLNKRPIDFKDLFDDSGQLLIVNIHL